MLQELEVWSVNWNYSNQLIGEGLCQLTEPFRCCVDVSGGAESGDCEDDAENNVIFIHGFCSSSSFWADTVFPFLSETIGSSHRLFAVDILGFGKSPKPANCMYSNADHVDMIRRLATCFEGRYSYYELHSGKQCYLLSVFWEACLPV